MSEREAGVYTLAEIRDGTGWPEGVLFKVWSVPVVDPVLADHEHEWVKVDEVHQGLTQIRTYECRGCLAHTTLTGPMGIRSPFEVEESTDG